MTAQYSNRQFFRKTPNLYLAKFFKGKGIQQPLVITFLARKEEVKTVLLNHIVAIKKSIFLLIQKILHKPLLNG